MSTITKPLESKIDSGLPLVDRKIIFQITQGNSSTYAVWVAMERESRMNQDEKRVMAYKNVHAHAINLAKEGYLEEVKVEGSNMHGRRDYKVTTKGIEQLIIHCISHPKDIKSIDVYMDKMKLDIRPFTLALMEALGSLSYAVNLHQKYIEDEISAKWENGRLIETKYTRKSKSTKKEDIDVALDKSFEQLHHYVETNNLMVTLHRGEIHLSKNPRIPNTPEEIAESSRQNIEQWRRTQPRTSETIDYIERLITKSTYWLNTKSKTSKPFTLPIKN